MYKKIQYTYIIKKRAFKTFVKIRFRAAIKSTKSQLCPLLTLARIHGRIKSVNLSICQSVDLSFCQLVYLSTFDLSDRLVLNLE